MNLELAEVRRYWPRAKMRAKVPYYAICANNWSDQWIKILIDCGMASTATGSAWYSCLWHRTIAEAMRAAGFGPRTPGLYRSCNGLKRNGCAGRILSACRIYPHQWFTALADRQRPRKGVRLGKRKRREVQP